MAKYGHVKISRKAYTHDPFWNEKREFSKWEAWEDLIQSSSWKKQRREIDGTIVMLERGQLIASERYLATRWNWSRGKVRRFLNRLESDLNRIRLKTDHPAAHIGAIITLCNYHRYQGGEPTSEPDDGP